MEPITLYFAGAWIGGRSKPQELKAGIRNKLCSYSYPEQFHTWSEVSRGNPGKILIDSGAFSAWNKAEVIDLDEYIKYSHNAISIAEQDGKEIRIVNLDVIPGKVGETSGLRTRSELVHSFDIIEDAAQRGFDNMMHMKDHGITPLHVYHQGEGFKWLDKMVEQTDYIGISPANDMPTDAKMEFIDTTFAYLSRHNIKVKTHGFAVWMGKVLEKYPWTSCDAATWRLLPAYGWIIYPRGGYSNPDFSKPPVRLGISSERQGNATLSEMWTHVEEVGAWRDLIETDGWNFEKLTQHWTERAIVCVRYFVEFEKWINTQKGDAIFDPMLGFHH